MPSPGIEKTFSISTVPLIRNARLMPKTTTTATIALRKTCRRSTAKRLIPLIRAVST